MSNGKSPDEIEREIEEAREDLRETVDALERKLSPGQMLDDALARLRAGGDGELMRIVRENPVPLLLIGIGIGWLFLSQMRRESYLYEARALPVEPVYPPPEGVPPEEWPENVRGGAAPYEPYPEATRATY